MTVVERAVRHARIWWKNLSIARRECHCTNEVFMWPSIAFPPTELSRALIHARVWSKPGRTGSAAAAG